MPLQILSEMFTKAAAWPDDDQRELADFARAIEARRTGLYRVTKVEREAIEVGMAEANRGDFVSDALLAAADNHHGL